MHAANARSRILAAARERFLSQGFRLVTMEELARELGMSKKTLYLLFPSKAALLEAMLLAKFGEMEAELTQIVAEQSADFSNCLRRMLACLHGHTDEIKPAFVRDVQRESPELFEMLRARRRALIERTFGKVFTSGKLQRRIRSDIPVPLMIEVLLAAVDGIVNPSKLTQLRLTPNRAFAAVISLVLEGALTARGKGRS